MVSSNNICRKLFIVLMAVGVATSLIACNDTNQKKASTFEEESEVITGIRKADMGNLDFSVFDNVEITDVNLAELSDEEMDLLYKQAKYCQAMTESDIETMMELTSPDMVFTHMSGRKQTREEYFADIADGSLLYFTIGIESPEVKIDGDYASISFTSVLNANAYGATGTYSIDGTHWFERQNGSWIACNAPQQ